MDKVGLSFEIGFGDFEHPAASLFAFSADHFHRFGLDLVLIGFAPHDKPDAPAAALPSLIGVRDKFAARMSQPAIRLRLLAGGSRRGARTVMQGQGAWAGPAIGRPDPH
jgi:hypothetical protein